MQYGVLLGRGKNSLISVRPAVIFSAAACAKRDASWWQLPERSPVPPLLPPAVSKQAACPPQYTKLPPRNTSTPFLHHTHLPPPTFHAVHLLPLPSIKDKGDRKDLPHLSYFSLISVPSYVAFSTRSNHLWNSIFAASLSNHSLAIVCHHDAPRRECPLRGDHFKWPIGPEKNGHALDNF